MSTTVVQTTSGRMLKPNTASRLLDVSGLATEYGPSRAFWREAVAKGLLPTIRPPQFRRVLVRREDVEALLTSWTEEASAE